MVRSMSETKVPRIAETVEYLAHISAENEGIVKPMIARDAALIHKAARRLHKIHENQCNGIESGRQDKEEDRLMSRITAIFELVDPTTCNNKVYFQSDPRGAPVYLYKLSDLNEKQKLYPEFTIACCYNSIGHAIYD